MITTSKVVFWLSTSKKTISKFWNYLWRHKRSERRKSIFGVLFGFRRSDFRSSDYSPPFWKEQVLQAFLVLFLHSFENRTNKGSWKNGIEPTIPIMCFRLVEFKYSTFEIKHVCWICLFLLSIISTKRHLQIQNSVDNLGGYFCWLNSGYRNLKIELY